MTEELNLLSVILEQADTHPSDGATGTWRQPTARFENPIWQLGFTDGRVGAPPKSIADLIGYLHTSIKGNATPPSPGSPATPGTTQKEREASHFEQISEERRSAELKYLRSPHLISSVLAAVELAFGSVLLIGDVGVNWSLLGNAFGLKQDLVMRSFLCAGIVAVAGIAMPFFEEWVFVRKQERPRRVATLALLCLMIGMAVVVAMVRTDEIRRDMQAQQRSEQVRSGTLPVAPTQSKDEPRAYLEGFAYGVLSMVFALSSGFFLSLGVHRLSEKRAFSRLVQLAPETSSAQSATQTVLELPVRRWDIPAGDAIQLLGYVYLHGYERGKAVRWTLREGESLYDHCLRVVRVGDVKVGHEQS